jgi:hypothetical protein
MTELIDPIFDGLVGAGRCLLTTFLVIVISDTSKDETRKSGRGSALKKGATYAAGLAFVLVAFMGRPSCEDADVDVNGSTCLSYADNGYKPSGEEKIEAFAFVFTLLFTPVYFGSGSSESRQDT